MEKDKKIITLKILKIILFVILFGFAWVSSFYADLNLIDEGQFAAWINHILLGKLPFKDIYITYGPLYFLPLYFFSTFLEPSAFLVRFYLALGGIFSILVFIIIQVKLKINIFLRSLSIFSLLFIPTMSLRHLFIFLAFLIFILDIQSKFKYFLLGLVVILAFFTSPELGIFLSLIILLFKTLSLVFCKEAKKQVMDLIIFFAGIAFGFIPFVIYSSTKGWFFSYLKNTLDILVLFSGNNLPNGMKIPHLSEIIDLHNGVYAFLKSILSIEAFPYWFMLILIIGIFYFLIKFSRNTIVTFDKKFLFIFAYTVLSSLLIISRPGIGHLFFVYPFILLTITYISNQLIVLFRKTNSKILLVLLAFLLLLPFRTINIIREDIKMKYENFRTADIQNNFPKRVGDIKISNEQQKYLSAIEKFILLNTKSNDYVFFLSNEPMMYMLVDRRNPARYDLPYIPTTLEKRYELLVSLEKTKPKYIFYDTKSWPVDGISNKKRLPEVINFINKNYTRNTIMDGRVEVYVLK